MPAEVPIDLSVQVQITVLPPCLRDTIYISIRYKHDANHRSIVSLLTNKQHIDHIILSINLLYIPKPSLLQHSPRHLAPPHSSQPGTTLGQTNRHAMTQTNPIQERTKRVRDVLVGGRVAADVLHEERATWSEGSMDAVEGFGGVGLVVNRVKDTDEVEG